MCSHRKAAQNQELISPPSGTGVKNLPPSKPVLQSSSPQSQWVSQSSPGLSAFLYLPPKPAWPLWKFCSIMSVDMHCSLCFSWTIKETSLEIASMCVWTRSQSKIDRDPFDLCGCRVNRNYFIRTNIDVTCAGDGFAHSDLMCWAPLMCQQTL